MISLTLGQILTLYAGLSVTIVFLISLTSHLRRIRAEKCARRRQIQCAFCGVIYEPPAAEPLPHCPSCAKPNEKIAPPGV